jgi:hypothetical protein
MSETAGCLICKEPLEQPTTGRPRVYCSTACRRAAELEIRRCNRRLERLEESASNLRLWGTATKQLPRVEAEIERAQARLLALLADREGLSPTAAD